MDWGHDLHIKALAISLKREIRVFLNISKKNHNDELLSGSNYLPNEIKYQPIYLQFINGNHYQLLMPSKYNLTEYFANLEINAS
jgi:hypothetical protein